MNIDPIINHQAWTDKDILSSRAEPSLDDFDSLQGIFFLVKGRLFLARSLSQGPQFWVRWTVNSPAIIFWYSLVIVFFSLFPTIISNFLHI